MSNNVTAPKSPTGEFSSYLDKLKPQMALALPKHMKADRMARLALTAFSSSQDMQRCEFRTIASSLMTAGALGLEPGVNGAGYLIPYKGVCTFVPGWKGLVDLVSRSGRATVWTGAVFEGDVFDYALGDRPYVRHQPGDETDPEKLTHVYAIGRINGSDHPVIEVWTMRKVWKHRDQLNKQGGKHYSFRHPEMYARKVPLLQVLKYMPSSIEVANAIAISDAAETGRHAVLEGDFVTVQENADQETGEIMPEKTPEKPALPAMTPEAFTANFKAWSAIVQSGKKTADQLIGTLQTRNTLTDEQQAEIMALENFDNDQGAAQ
jgi:recombination protein RecT